MKKNLFYLLILLLVGFGVYYFVFKDKDRTFSEEETNFTIKDTATVGRIFMVRTSGQFIDLKRTSNGWTTNDIYPSRTSTVSSLLRILHKQVARYPVSEKQHNYIVKSMSGNSVKVEVYDLTGKVMTKFYVGPDEEKAFGTYLYNEGAKRIFFAQIPNFDGCLSSIYSTNLDDWRSRNVFNVPTENIAQATITYPNEPLKSFTIQQDKGIKLIADKSASKNNPLNERRAKVFLGFFSDVNCEGYLTNIPGIDSIIAMVPKLCNIKVTDKKGMTKEADVYYMLLNKRSKSPGTAILGKFDHDRLYAVFNNHKDTAVIQYLSFDKFFRTAEEFFVSDSVQSSVHK